MKEWFTTQDLVGITGLPSTVRGINKLTKTVAWKSRKKAKGKGNEYHIDSLPAVTQAALAKAAHGSIVKAPKHEVEHCSQSVWQRYDIVSDKMKSVANKRAQCVAVFLELSYQDLPKKTAAEQAAEQFGFSVASLYRWYAKVKKTPRPDWCAVLVSGHTGKTKEAEFTPEAFEFIKADWLRLESPSVAACYDRLERSAPEHGWTIPTMRTVARRLDKLPASIRVLKREGEIALMTRYPAIERSVKDLYATEAINGDGYQHNVFVRWPDGQIKRPKTWFWQDVHSRKILSYRVDQTENTDTIRLSFGDLVEQFGIPKHVTIDNTRAAANKWMTGGLKNRYRFKIKEDDPMGIFTQLNINVHWTSVNKAGTQAKGHGQAKPIERAFGVGGIGEYADLHPDFSGAFTGTNPTAKPENYGKEAIPLDKFVRTLNQVIIEWNNKQGRHTEMANGSLSFDEVFKRSYEVAPIQKANEQQRRLWLLASESITVKKDGTFTLLAGSKTGQGADGRNRYYLPELQEFGERKQKIIIRFEPHQLHQKVYAYTLSNVFIGEAECIEAKGFYDNAHSREHNKARRQFINATKLAAKAEINMDIAGVSERISRPELPADVIAKVIIPAQIQLKETAPKAPEQDPEYAAIAEAARLTYEQEKKENKAEETPAQRYQRWVTTDEKLKAGDTLQEHVVRWHTNYPTTAEYRAERRMATNFKLVSSN